MKEFDALTNGTLSREFANYIDTSFVKIVQKIFFFILFHNFAIFINQLEARIGKVPLYNFE